ncbi:hypothetical protein C8F01DRAFT_1362443 [Mycena amicta]|nr:hypothetical protein C8F01DRAFT_1362443 [Mycena amicta]
MDSLPYELLAEIASFVSHEDILNLRLVQRRFKEVVTRKAFRLIVVHDTYPSVSRFLTLVDECMDAAILDGVECVTFDGKILDHFEMGAEPTIPTIENAFSKLGRFPNLNSLSLDFFPGSAPDEHEIYMSYYVSIQVAFWKLLAEQALRIPNLRRLNIGAMVSFLPQTITEEHPFVNLFRPLTTLSIYVVSLFQIRRLPMPILEFNDNLRRILFFANNLTTLDLGTVEFLGPTAPFNFESYRFPRLATLRLSNIVFAALEDGQEPPPVEAGQQLTVEKFILNHRAGLRRLELHDCVAALPDGEWHRVFGRFQHSLASLVEFTWVISKLEEWENMFLYAHPNGRLSIYTIAPGVKDQREDVAALEQLQAAVAIRCNLL